MLLLALALAALVQTPDTTDAPRPPTARAASRPADDDGRGVEVRARFEPSALYSRDYGVGVGVGVGVRNLGAAGTELTADVRLQRHYQGAEVVFRTSGPYARRLSAVVAAGGFTTDRRFYAGVGPAPRSASLDLTHDAARAELGVLYYPLGTTALSVRPSAGLRVDRSDGVAEGRGSLADLDAASRRAVEAALDTRTGGSLALEIGTDLRDRPGRPRRGLLATAAHRRFAAFDASDLALAQTTVLAAGYVPLGDRATAIVHGVGVVTRGGDGQLNAVPFVYLPTLDGDLATPFRRNRLAGRDVLAVGAGVRATVVDVYGLYGLDVLAMGYVGNAYDSVFEQFSPAVSFGPDGVLDEGRAALRPGLALGLGLADLDDGRAVLAAQIGVGPGGVSLAALRVAYDLRRLGPTFW